MMRRGFFVFACAFGMLQVAGAQSPQSQSRATPAAPTQSPATAPITKLPVRRVVLYKNGVGYFEHVGRVRGSQSVAIDLNTAQLNDVLKSLTAIDLGDGRITNVSFNSDAPFTQRLRELTLPVGEKTTLPELLGALRGARLEVRSADRVFVGRLLSVERRPRKDEAPRDELTLVTDAGDMRSIELTPAVSVKVLERDSADQVSAYLGLLASNRAQDHRRLTIGTIGTSARDVLVSYISEVPIWKTTYRLVLPTDGTPVLQGWAVVDNTIGEDWDGVELSLVAGAPQSSVQPLSQPLYTQRPVVGISRVSAPIPQVHQETLTERVGAVIGRVVDSSGAVLPGVSVTAIDSRNRRTPVVTDGQGRYVFSGLQADTYRVEYSLSGFREAVIEHVVFDGAGGPMQDISLQIGPISEAVTVSAESPSIRLSNRRGVTAGNGSGGGFVVGGVGGGIIGGLAAAPMAAPVAVDRASVEERLAGMQSSAQGQSLGDLFEYRVTSAVTIRKNQSALVPILRADVEAERVSLWNDRIGGPRPLRSLWLTNSSGLTLDAGSFTVLEGSTFAGEGLLDPIKPGEKRLLSYAVDLGVQIDQQRGDVQQRTSRIEVARGVAVQRSDESVRRVYTIRNSDTSARIIVIEHPIRPGWTLAKGVVPVETSIGAYRFAVPVDAKSVATLIVEERHPSETTYSVSSLTDQQIAVIVRSSGGNPGLTQALAPLRAKKEAIASLAARLDERQTEANSIASDQQRLRDNIGALKGGAANQLMKRYVTQLNDQEDRIDMLRRETADLEQQLSRAQAELVALIQALTLDLDVVEADDLAADRR